MFLLHRLRNMSNFVLNIKDHKTYQNSVTLITFSILEDMKSWPLYNKSIYVKSAKMLGDEVPYMGVFHIESYFQCEKNGLMRHIIPQST